MKTITKEMANAVVELENKQGKITAEKVVREASDPSNPLHSWFDWNDSTAAHAHRLEQARELIRCVRLEITVIEQEVRIIRQTDAPAYVRDVGKKGNEAGYMSLAGAHKAEVGDIMANELKGIESLVIRAISIAEIKSKELPFVAKQLKGVLIGIRRIQSKL